MSAEWIAVTERLPPVGERVEVRHELNHSYDCTGQYNGGGDWSCANAFIVPPHWLAWNPTHWRSLFGAAQGIEAATAAETVKHGSVHESPVPKECAQPLAPPYQGETMTKVTPEQDAGELKACRECGADCRIELMGGGIHCDSWDGYICSKAKLFGGECPDENVYMSVADWNTRPATPIADTAIDEALARVERQLSRCSDSFEAPSGKIMYRVWCNDLHQVAKLARQALTHPIPTAPTAGEVEPHADCPGCRVCDKGYYG